MQGRQGQTVPESPWPVHDPWHGLLVSKLIGHMHEASSNVEPTRYPVMTCHVFIPLKIAWIPTKPGLSQWVSNQIMANGCCFTDVYVIADIIWQEPIRACRIQCQLPSRRLIELRWSHQDIKLDCMRVDGATLSACIKEFIYVRCHVECAALTGNGLIKYIQTDANEWWDENFGKINRFEIKNKTERRNQSSPKSTRTLTVLRCIFGQNLEILTSIGGDLSHGQGQNGVNCDFKVKFDLEVQGQSSQKTIGS